jgi:hypothetical protein
MGRFCYIGTRVYVAVKFIRIGSYNLEHNYGHGKEFLSTVLCLLMLLVFFIDQIQGITCSLFQAIKKRAGSFQFLWEKFRVLFEFVEWLSWKELYRFIISRKLLNTS